MKKIICALTLLAVMAGFCGYITWRVDQICVQSAELLTKAETRCEMGDYEEAGDMVSASKALWRKHENLLGMALRHTESESVEFLYPTLLEACRQKDQTEFLLRSRELGAVLRHLPHMEKPFFFNIL